MYAANCAYFPSLPLASLPTPCEGRDGEEGLATIAEDVGADGAEIAAADLDDSASDASDASAASDMLTDAGGCRHLPVLALEVPSPATWHLLHVRLHSSDGYEWQRSLLDVPGAGSPGEARRMLAGLGSDELQARLARVHGVWQNCCALGVTNGKVWDQLASAWGVLVDVLVERATRS